MWGYCTSALFAKNIYLKLELNYGVLITRSGRMSMPVYSPWTFFFALGTLSQLSVSDESLFSFDFYLSSIVNLLSLALLSLCPQSYVMGTLDSFSCSSIYYLTERIGVIVLCGYCRCHSRLESALC